MGMDKKTENKVTTKPVVKKLTRLKTDRMLFGVCSGIAEYLNVDVTIIRLLFVILTVSGGSGLFIYLVMSFIVPEEGSTAKTTGEVLKENGKTIGERAESLASSVETIAKTKNTQLWIGLGVIAFGVILMLENVGILDISRFLYIFVRVLWPLAIIFLGTLILRRNTNGK